MVCVKPYVSLVVWWKGDEHSSCNKRFNSGGLLFCCTKLKTTWWQHCLILAWPISGKGRFISTHTWKSNIQAVYPFSTPEWKNGKSRQFLVFNIFWKNKHGAVSVFNKKKKIKKINIHRPFQDSIIPKYSEYPHRCGDWQPHINSKPQIHPRRGAVPMRNPCKENNSANNCNCKFQTEMAIKRQNLLQLKNISFLLWWIVKCNLFLWFKAEFSASLLQSSVPHDPSESFYSIYTYLCFPTGRKDSVTNDYWRPHEWIHWPDRWYCPFWK